MNYKEAILKDMGYQGHELLMNPETGSVDTAKNWAEDCLDWYVDILSIEEQFNNFIKVEWKEKAGWVEVAA